MATRRTDVDWVVGDSARSCWILRALVRPMIPALTGLAQVIQRERSLIPYNNDSRFSGVGHVESGL